MTLKQLRIFVLVTRYGHMTRAAQKLGITQSAASAAIAALERQYNVKLFNRVGRAIELSEAGRVFLTEAQAVLDRAQAAEITMTALGSSTFGKLEIAASQTIANYWLPRRLAVFHERYPGINLNVTISNTREVENAVVNGSANVGFVEGTIQSSHLVLDEVDHDQPAMVVSAKRWLSLGSGRKRIDLTSVPWVVREPGSGTRGILETLAERNGLAWSDLNIVLELPSNEAVREAVEAGVGAALLSRHVVVTAIDAGTLRALPLDVPPRSYHMVRHHAEPTNDAMNALVEMVLSGDQP